MPRRPKTSASGSESRREDELVSLESAQEVLDGALDGLRLTLRTVTAIARKTAEAPRMPNYARAAEQLRVAMNAAQGAVRSLRRRAELLESPRDSVRDP